MAIQVVRARERAPDTSAQFIQAFGKTVGDIGSAYFKNRAEKERMEKENEAIKDLTGVDVSGIKDQKIREKITEYAIQNRGNENEKKLVGKSLSGEKLTLEEQSSLSPKTQLELAKINNPKKTQASQPIDEDQMRRIKNVRNEPGYEELSPSKKYRELTSKGVSRENAKDESDIYVKEQELSQKSFESSYKANEDFINDTTKAARAYESETKPKLMQLQKLVSDEELIGPTPAVFLETLGIPLGALEDPSSELYQKVSLDLLKGLPETFGNRIMKVEVDNFLKTIPTLLNSPEGRRMITSNMLKLGEMKQVFYNEMRKQQKEALEKNKFPRDFQQSVFDQVKPQVDRINEEFVKMSEIKSIPKDTVPFFTPNGQIKFIPKDKVEQAMEKGGRRIW